MKIIVTTCDKYVNILKGFIYMFNKHWPFTPEVTIIGYRFPSFNLPDNFKFISLGKQEKYGKDWTSALIPYFEQLPDEYFLLLLDDYYILNVNESSLHMAEEYMKKGIEKVYLTHLGGYSEPYKNDVNFDIYRQNAEYRLSLQPSFIRRDYFLNYLSPGKNIWQYEMNFQDPVNDGARQLMPKQDIVSYSNFILKGNVSREGISKMKKEDLDIIKLFETF